MSTFKQTTIVTAVLLALAGCSDEDYKGRVDSKTENTIPTHGGNIVHDIYEATYDDDGIPSYTGASQYYLLGTPNGDITGDGMAIDADGDLLKIKNLTYTVTDSSDPNFDPTDNTGMALADGDTLLIVNPAKLRLDLDSGQTRTVEYNYEITDGVESIGRQLKITVHGEDFMPVSTGPLDVTYSKAAGMETIDLLTGISDFDGEDLNVKAGSIQVVGTHEFDLPITLEGNQLKVDVASVKDQIPDEQYLAFNFTYVVADHNNELVRELTVGLLGVEPQPGEPYFANYFLKQNLTENSNVTEIDLAIDVFDTEGEDVTVKDLQYNGSTDLPAGFSLEGNMLTVVPATYASTLQPGDEEEFVLDFKIEDESGNSAQGRRTLTVKIAGEENNLLVANGFNAGFEDVTKVGDVGPDGNTNGFNFPWPHNNQNGCTVNKIQESSAHSGSYGFRMEGNFCANVVPGNKFIQELAAEDKYLVSYWLRSEEVEAGGNGNPYVVVYGDYWSGGRYSDETLNVWNQVMLKVDASSDAYSSYLGQALSFNMGKYAGNGKHDIDDYSLIRYSGFMHPSLDLLVDDYGLFDNNETINNDAGTAEISDGKLAVDTTGATNGVTLTLPVKANAVKADHYYVVSFDIENTTSEEDSNYTVKLTNGSESIMASGVTSDGTVELIINEQTARSADIDWSGEAMSFTLTLSDTDAKYQIDNVRVYAVPMM